VEGGPKIRRSGINQANKTRPMWNRRFAALDEFPFRRLAAMLAGITPPADRPMADLSLGEPQHRPPPILASTLAAHAGLWNKYPPPAGTPAFRLAAADWLTRRFGLPEGWLVPDRHILRWSAPRRHCS
jgi:aspartate/methionine/tyrosine aminotransferase